MANKRTHKSQRVKSQALNDRLFEASINDLEGNEDDADTIDVFGADANAGNEGGGLPSDEDELELDDSEDDDDLLAQADADAEDGDQNGDEFEDEGSLDDEDHEGLLSDIHDLLARLETYIEDDDDEEGNDLEDEAPEAEIDVRPEEDEEDLGEATLPKANQPSGKEGFVDEDEAERPAFAASSQTKKTSLPAAKAIRALVQSMSKMPLKDLGMMQKVASRLSDRSTVKESIDRDVTNEVEALISLDDSLSEDFKIGAAELFNSAVNSKLDEALDTLEADYAVALTESMERQQIVLVQKLDEFLDFAVDEFFKENKMAIDSNIRTEIAEGFLDDMHKLFQERYIEVPTGKVNVHERTVNELAEAKTKINNVTKTAIKYRNMAQAFQRELMVNEEAYDLSDMETDKLRGLAEGIDFKDVKSFKADLKRMKSNFITETVTHSDEFETETLVEDTSNSAPSRMDAYKSALSFTNR